MHLLFHRRGWEQVVASAFAANEVELRSLIDNSTPADLHSLRSLAMALGHASPELATRIWNGWQPSKAASLINQADPDSYQSVTWLLSSIHKHSPEWLKEVGSLLQWSEISQRLDRVCVGDIDSITQCVDLLRGFGRPVHRSMIPQFTDAIIKALKDAHLADFRLGFPTPWWWIFFPNEVSRIIATLDCGRLADDVAGSRPREWRFLVEFMHFLGPVGDELLADIFQRLDVNAFISHVRAQAVGCEYEFRCLLWTLNRAAGERKQQLAHGLYAEILESCRRSATERPHLIKAYGALDRALAVKLATELGFEATEDEKDVGNVDTIEKAALQIRERIAVLDASGEDYIVDEVGDTPAANGPELQEPPKEEH
jgi:hypothetical protein